MKKLKNLLCNKDFCLGVVFVSMFVVCVGASLASISISLGLGLVAFGGVFAVPSIIISDKLLKKQNSNNQENIKVNNSKTNNNSQQNNIEVYEYSNPNKSNISQNVHKFEVERYNIIQHFRER